MIGKQFWYPSSTDSPFHSETSPPREKLKIGVYVHRNTTNTWNSNSDSLPINCFFKLSIISSFSFSCARNSFTFFSISMRKLVTYKYEIQLLNFTKIFSIFFGHKRMLINSNYIPYFSSFSLQFHLKIRQTVGYPCDTGCWNIKYVPLMPGKLFNPHHGGSLAFLDDYEEWHDTYIRREPSQFQYSDVTRALAGSGAYKSEQQVSTIKTTNESHRNSGHTFPWYWE